MFRRPSPGYIALTTTLMIFLGVTLIDAVANVLYIRHQNSKALNYLTRVNTSYIPPASVQDAAWFLFQIGALGFDDLDDSVKPYRGYKNWYLNVERVSPIKCKHDPVHDPVDIRINLIRDKQVIDTISTLSAGWVQDQNDKDVFWSIHSINFFTIYFKLERWSTTDGCDWASDVITVRTLR